MNRLILAAFAALALGGCYPEGEYVVAASPGGVSVASAPPPLQYEVQLNCGADVWVPGSWDWNGGWTWQAGRCMPYQAGFVYNQPYYAGGIYYRGYWGRPAPYYHGGYYGGGYYRGGVYVGPGYNRGYVGPAYGGRAYVGPPAAYGGRAYVGAPPAYRAAPAAPAYRAPAGGRYVGPPPARR